MWFYHSFKFVTVDMKERQRGITNVIYFPNEIFLKSILPMNLLQQEAQL